MPEAEVVIVGAGLAGLCCALRLQERNIRFRILEASDAPGGRIRTDRVDGFLLDRGFQVLLTAYPEAKRVLDYRTLELDSFHPGALVRYAGSLHRVADPLRTPLDALPGVFSPIGTFLDKLRVLKLRNRTVRGSLESVLAHPERTTLEELREIGFSDVMIDRFFRPFLGGIFLEKDLVTSSRKFEFVFRMFSEGEAALPARGMQAIPEQLASRLPLGSIAYKTQVTRIEDGTLTTAQGMTITARDIVVAVDQPQAMRLLGHETQHAAAATVCLYFDAPESPVKGAWLVLDGDGLGLVNNVCVPSEVTRTYAPPGRALVSVSVVGNCALDDSLLQDAVRLELSAWFGSTAEWRHLRTYRVPFSLPAQRSGALSPIEKTARVNNHVVLCGDHMDIASINGAMLSGRRAADAIAG